MADIGKLLKDEIRRLARSEIRREVEPLARQLRELRREIAELKRSARDRDAAGERAPAAESAAERRPSAAEVRSARVTARSIAATRKRLKLSQRELAALVGVTENAVYFWESGRSRPRGRRKAALVELRRIGVREARRRLAAIEKRPAATST